MNNPIELTCTCGRGYILGMNGTVDGCDECQGVIRNPLDHTIIDEPEDSLTDMEKA